MAFPAGYHGHMLQKAVDTHADNKQPWYCVSTFDHLTYWNHDAAPIKSDLMRKCLDWLELSQQVCAISDVVLSPSES